MLPSGKLRWQWKITMFDRKYIFKGFLFNCYVSLPECTSTCDPLKKEKNKNTLPPKNEEELVVPSSPSIQKSRSIYGKTGIFW